MARDQLDSQKGKITDEIWKIASEKKGDTF